MKNVALLIEPMTEADVEDVVAVDLESLHPADLRSDADAVRAQRDQQLREELARTWARLRVARDASSRRVLGYIVFWHVTDEIHLLNVAVDPRERRRGIGRALVEELLAYARACAATKALLEVRASNEPAILLYESLGFERFNVRKAYYSDGEDGVEMMLELEPV